MGIFTKIYTYINNKVLFDPNKDHPSVQEQKDFLYKFPSPQNAIERSTYKYKCLVFYSYSRFQKMLINTLSFFALIVFVPYYRLKGRKRDSFFIDYKPEDKLLRRATKRISIADIFPDNLCKDYADIEDYELSSYRDLFIEKEAFDLYKRGSHGSPFSFHYRLVLLIRLAQASYLLYTYRPKAITTYVCEREFADPILTEYYEGKGVQYHGHMHGEYLFSIEQAFMQYSKYWLWGSHYVDLFNTLRCEFKTETYTPKKLSGIVKPRNSIEEYDYYATYYFSNETRDSIIILKEALLKIQEKGHRCKVRPHPRFSNMEAIKECFEGLLEIEDPAAVSIEESLECSYISIALSSTVLSQAYYSDKEIAIDDISNPEKYKELREKEYILIDKANYLLSELI